MKKNFSSKNKLLKLLLIINIIISILFFLSVFSFNRSPVEYSILLFLPIIFWILFFMNIIFFVVWLFIKWRMIFIPVISLLFSLKILLLIFPISSYFSFSKKEKTDLKIMSYNVYCFGLYKWEKISIKNKIIQTINNEAPDIICLQEAFWVPKTKNFITIDSLKKTLKYKYDYRFTLAKAAGNQNFGLVIISRYPIINSYGKKFENSLNGFIYADILKDKDTIRIFNLHLESLHFGEEDYKTIENINDKEKNINLNDIANLYSKYLKSYKKRAKQVDIIKAEIDICKKTKFICGDFNDLSLSYTYSKIRGNNLYDSYLACGKIKDYTWHKDKLKIRIDYIFSDINYECKSYNVIKEPFSDHFPIVAEYYKKQKNK